MTGRGRGLAFVLAAILALAAIGLAVMDLVEPEESVDKLTFDDLAAQPSGGAGRSEILVVEGRTYRGSAVIRAQVAGGRRGGVRYARALWTDVGWRPRDEVSFGAAFFLPIGFKDSAGRYVSLMRWDDWPGTARGITYVGVAMYGSDRKFRLVRERYRGKSPEGQVELLGKPFDLPEGKWFRLDVSQQLSQADDGMNEVFVDGRSVGRRAAKNHYGGSVRYVRIGIVAVGDGIEGSLRLWFDDAYARRESGRQLK